MFFQHCHGVRCSPRSILLYQELSTGALRKVPKAPAVRVHCQVKGGDTKPLNSPELHQFQWDQQTPHGCCSDPQMASSPLVLGSLPLKRLFPSLEPVCSNIQQQWGVLQEQSPIHSCLGTTGSSRHLWGGISH